MHSCIYRGTVEHRRLEPRRHQFRYSLYMLYLDLSELDEVFRGHLGWSYRWPAWNWFRRRDHLGSSRQPLDRSVREFVESRTGVFPEGPIRLLTQVRQLGFLMNPVAFYFVYAPGTEELEYVLAQVNNTPWNEEHIYLLTADMWDRSHSDRSLTSKEFHVSPFLPMKLEYRWQLVPPRENVRIQMEVGHQGSTILDVYLQMDRMPLTRGNRLRMMCRFPWMTWSIFRRIYWQAFLLFCKKIPFYPHPKKAKSQENG